MSNVTYSTFKKALNTYMMKHYGEVGDTIVRLPKDAKAYSEFASKNALAWVSVDGSPLYDAINCDDIKGHDRFTEFMASMGLWFEPGNSWNFNVYKQD